MQIRGSVAKRRRNARQKAVQALYQWDFDSADTTAWDIYNQFVDLQNMDWVDVDYFKELFFYAIEHQETIDEHLLDCIDRSMERLDPVERSVLRVTAAELICRLDIPYRVSVNEALEITKVFGSEQGFKFVNGVLDKLSKRLRSIEYGMPRDKP